MNYFILLIAALFLVGCGREVIIMQDTPAQQIYAHGSHNNDAGTSFAIAAADTYYNITLFDNILSQGFTVQDNKSVVMNSGPYAVNFAASFAGGANQEYHVAIGVNGEEKRACHASRKIGTGGDVGNMGGTCLLQLEAGDVVTLMVENEGGTADITIQDISVNMVLI